MDKEIVMWLIGGLFMIIWYFMSRKIVELEKSDAAHNAEIMALKEAKSELRLHIAENYVKRIEIKDFMESINSNLKQIYAELKSKADK